MPLNLKSVANGSVILNPASTVTDKTITIPATDGTMLVQDGTNTTTITNLAYTGTLTGGTGVINIGSGQVYKDASGNLGIGTSSPGYQLNTSKAGGIGDAGQLVRFTNTSIGNSLGPFHLTVGTANYFAEKPGMVLASTNSLGFAIGDGSDLANQRKMLLDTSGNLGLGVTPSAWSSGKAFEIGSKGNGLWAAVGFTDLAQNVYYDGAYKYGTNGAATRLDLESGIFRFFTAPSGTAGNAITFTQAMTLTAAGDLGIGTTSPAAKLDVNGIIQCRMSGSAQIYTISTSATDQNNTIVSLYNNGATYAIQNYDAAQHVFKTSGGERGRFDASGRFGVNGTPATDSWMYGRNNTAGYFAGTFENYSGGGYGMSVGSDSAYLVYFYSSGNRAGGAVGSITHNGTATTYGTSSDYRLKNITGELTNSGGFIDALKPKVGIWKADGSPFVGFLAHEFAQVSPSSVTGEKDAVDANGKPIYQAMQASSAEVMANIIAELQSLRKRVAELEAA